MYVEHSHNFYTSTGSERDGACLNMKTQFLLKTLQVFSVIFYTRLY